MKNFTNYITINDAAKMLGVSSATLRNWDSRGKLIAYRHPVNGYRLYQENDLKKLLKKIQVEVPKQCH